MPKVARLTFDDLPLFAPDRDIAEAVVGPDEADKRAWCASIEALEKCGFPKTTQLYGKRYTPAVRAFYDRQYGPAQASAGDHRHEDTAQWASRPSRRRA